MRLIDADALKDNLVNDMVVDGWETVTAYMKGERRHSDYLDGIENALYCINNADTVDPAKHGKWEDKGSLSCRCSECGCKSPKEYPYCPNCGAMMLEGEPDETN